MNPLNSIPAAIVSGVVLAIIVIAIIPGSGFNEFSLTRWLHILSGIMWIGLLFYVNVAQIPALTVAAADKGGPGGAPGPDEAAEIRRLQARNAEDLHAGLVARPPAWSAPR